MVIKIHDKVHEKALNENFIMYLEGTIYIYPLRQEKRRNLMSSPSRVGGISCLLVGVRFFPRV
jgi:hypothetical protein